MVAVAICFLVPPVLCVLVAPFCGDFVFLCFQTGGATVTTTSVDNGAFSFGNVFPGPYTFAFFLLLFLLYLGLELMLSFCVSWLTDVFGFFDMAIASV